MHTRSCSDIMPFCLFRLEFDLAMQSGDLKRALQTLIIFSNSRRLGQDIDLNTDDMGVLYLTASKEAKAEVGSAGV